MERETKLVYGRRAQKKRGGRGGGRGESAADVAIVRAGGAAGGLREAEYITPAFFFFQGETVVPGGGEVMLWTAPAMKESEAPDEADASNILWCNKGNGKKRRLPVLNNRSGDGIELLNPDNQLASFARAP